MILFADAVCNYGEPERESTCFGGHMVVEWKDPGRSVCCKAAHNNFRVMKPHLFCTAQFIS